MTMPLPAGYSAARILTQVFPSLAASLGAAWPNTLQLPKATSALLLLVDGLGLEQLEQYSAHAPFLRRVLCQMAAAQTEMSTLYPSTTAAALSSLGTRLAPGGHGLVGDDVSDPELQAAVK